MAQCFFSKALSLALVWVCVAGCNQFGDSIFGSSSTSSGGSQNIPKLPTLGKGSPEERLSALEDYANILSDYVVEAEDNLERVAADAQTQIQNSQSQIAQKQSKYSALQQRISEFPRAACEFLQGATWDSVSGRCTPANNNFSYTPFGIGKILYNEVNAYTCQIGGLDQPGFPSGGVCQVLPQTLQSPATSGSGYNVYLERNDLRQTGFNVLNDRLRMFYVNSYDYQCETLEVRLRATAQFSDGHWDGNGWVRFKLERLAENGAPIGLNPKTAFTGASWSPFETLLLRKQVSTQQGVPPTMNFYDAERQQPDELFIYKQHRNAEDQALALFGARDFFLTPCSTPGCRDFFRVQTYYLAGIPTSARLTVICHQRPNMTAGN